MSQQLHMLTTCFASSRCAHDASSRYARDASDSFPHCVLVSTEADVGWHVHVLRGCHQCLTGLLWFSGRPDVSQYRKPERWLMNLFEDALKETLETTQLPCNVSKINDCMKRLDPTYRLDETGAAPR
jgi:hypothetical protein